MKTNYLMAFLLGLAVFALPIEAQGRSQAELVVALRSSDPGTRASAFQALQAKPGGLSAPGVSNALADLLEKENQLIESTIRDSHGRLGIVDVYGEDYGEYVSQLASECATRCELRNPRVVLMLAETFPGESPEATHLAAMHGSLLLPIFLDKMSGQGIDRRRNALVWLGEIAVGSNTLSSQQTAMLDSSLVGCVTRTCLQVLVEEALSSIEAIVTRRADLSASRRTLYHRTVVAAMSSTSEDIRFGAVGALAAFRDSSDLALLERLRQRDTKLVGNAAAAASAKIRAHAP